MVRSGAKKGHVSGLLESQRVNLIIAAPMGILVLMQAVLRRAILWLSFSAQRRVWAAMGIFSLADLH